jgi:hypothetical protein
MDDIYLNDRYSKIIAGLDNESNRYGFLRKYWDEAIDKIEQKIEDDNSWIKPNNCWTGILYSLFEDEFEVLDSKNFENSYHIEVEKDELHVLENRIRKHFDRGYDETELIAILKA